MTKRISINTVTKTYSSVSLAVMMIVSFFYVTAYDRTYVTDLVFITGILLSIGIFVILPNILSKLLINQVNIVVSGINNILENPENYSDDIKLQEFNDLVSQLSDYASKNKKEKTILRNTEQTLLKMAYTDQLTGAGNRFALHNDWNNLMKSPVASSRIEVGLALIDVNKFKYINDKFGHDVGDKALVTIVDIIRRTVRSGDKIYRLGGDEFVVMFVDTAINEVLDVMTRCSVNISDFDSGSIGSDRALGVSIGLSNKQGPFKEEDLSVLLKFADCGAYESKLSKENKGFIIREKGVQSACIPSQNN